MLKAFENYFSVLLVLLSHLSTHDDRVSGSVHGSVAYKDKLSPPLRCQYLQFKLVCSPDYMYRLGLAGQGTQELFGTAKIETDAQM